MILWWYLHLSLSASVMFEDVYWQTLQTDTPVPTDSRCDAVACSVWWCQALEWVCDLVFLFLFFFLFSKGKTQRMCTLWHNSSLPTPLWTLKKQKCILLTVVSVAFGHCFLGFYLCGKFRVILTWRTKNISTCISSSSFLELLYFLAGLIDMRFLDTFIFGLFLSQIW